MSGATFSDLETYGSLKELYSEETVYQENVVNSLYDFLRHAGDGEGNFDGKQWNIDCLLQLNESYSGLVDDEHLPESGLLKGVYANYKPKKTIQPSISPPLPQLAAMLAAVQMENISTPR